MNKHLRRSMLALALAALALPLYSAENETTTDAGDDFVQGKRVIVASDFSRDPLGAFPRIFQLKSGNMEVAMVKGKRFLRATSHGEIAIPLPEVLPQRFTMEFDLAGSGGWYQEVHFASDEDPYFVSLRPEEDGGIQGPDGYDVRSAHGGAVTAGEPYPIRIMADGQYVKVYINGKRVANAPNAKIGRASHIRFRLMADTDTPALIGNLRIAAGGKDLYRALNDDGRFTAEGILFDSNSDRIRPESANVLNEIASVLIAHPDLRVAVEGHTDNTGSQEANQSLSQRRAAAVKAWLATHGKVPVDRLEAQGLGSTRPAASNETAEGRQTNRRVELVRL